MNRSPLAANLGPGYRDAYAPSCRCNMPGAPTRNYAGHEVAPPTCSGCGAVWHLRIERCASYVPAPRGER